MRYPNATKCLCVQFVALLEQSLESFVDYVRRQNKSLRTLLTHLSPHINSTERLQMQKSADPESLTKFYEIAKF